VARSMADDRAALQVALSAYFASQQFAILGGIYVERSLVPSAVLWVNAWRPLPHLIAWAAVLAWGGCAALTVSFDVLSWRAQQRLRAVLPEAREAVQLHFAPAPLPSVSLLLAHALVPVGGILCLHALGSDLLSPGMLWLGTRCWLVVVGLWLAVRWSDQLV